MSNFGKRLKQIRLSRGMSQDEFARLLGTSKQVISHYETNQRSPKISMAVEFAKRLGIPLSALGDDEPLPSNISTVSHRRIRVLGGIAAGTPQLMEQEYEDYVEADDDFVCDYALHVDGDSMEPTIHLGDIVFIREQPDVDDGTIAAVAIDSSATLKRVLHIQGGLKLLSDNTRYKPLIYTGDDAEQVRIIGKAVAFKRRL